MSQLFRAWDANGDGQVSRLEFTRGLDALGLPASKMEVQAFFSRFDPDGSGQLSLREIEAAIRQVNPAVAAAADTPALSQGQGQANALQLAGDLSAAPSLVGTLAFGTDSDETILRKHFLENGARWM